MSGKPSKSPEAREGGSGTAAKSKRASASFGKTGPNIRRFLNGLVGVVIASFVFGCLITICQPPENLPVPGTPGNALAVMQVIAQAKASRGSDLAELSNRFRQVEFEQGMVKLIPEQ